ncbi:pectin lyase fold/virulence factor [Phyllosticta citricarpa]|uniref:Pectin lyase fold/virulence factor n=2 Tax=Phyllosticta TaxID=121621 RepID=A0ABR1MDY3_9PEZI
MADFTGLGVIDGNKYGDKGLSYKAIGVFLRQIRHIRNFVIDITDIPASVTATPTGIHWPMSQGTVIPNVVLQMSRRPGSQQQGIFMEEGSGGLMADLVFCGDWGWNYESIHVEDCKIGVNMTAQSPESQNIGSIFFVDSEFVNAEAAFNTSRDEFSKPPTGGTLVIENVNFTIVKNIVHGPKDSVTLPGSSGTTVVDASGQGHWYTPTGPVKFEGYFTPNERPSSLKDDNEYFKYSRPSYAGLTVSDIVSVHGYGATGNGRTDYTSAFQRAVTYAAKNNKLLFIDAGSYIMTRTLYFPAGLKITGEAYSVILSAGSYFTNIDVARPVVQVGLPGKIGKIEWTYMVVSGQGLQSGAILIEENLKSPDSQPCGIWYIHTRLGGFQGSRMGLNDRPKAPGTSLTPETENADCFAAFAKMHITPSAAGLHVENAIDEVGSDFKINVYTGRGIWVDRYQITGSKDIFIGFG